MKDIAYVTFPVIASYLAQPNINGEDFRQSRKLQGMR